MAAGVALMTTVVGPLDMSSYVRGNRSEDHLEFIRFVKRYVTSVHPASQQQRNDEKESFPVDNFAKFDPTSLMTAVLFASF